MNRKLPILIAATVGLFILTTNISVNSVIASTHRDDYGEMPYGYGGMPYGYGEMPYGYGGMGHGGAGPIIQEPVNIGNSQLHTPILYRTHMRIHQLYKKQIIVIIKL